MNNLFTNCPSSVYQPATSTNFHSNIFKNCHLEYFDKILDYGFTLKSIRNIFENVILRANLLENDSSTFCLKYFAYEL